MRWPASRSKCSSGDVSKVEGDAMGGFPSLKRFSRSVELEF
jgi:hypothetical protein